MDTVYFDGVAGGGAGRERDLFTVSLLGRVLYIGPSTKSPPSAVRQYSVLRDLFQAVPDPKHFDSDPSLQRDIGTLWIRIWFQILPNQMQTLLKLSLVSKDIQYSLIRMYGI